MLTIGAHMSVAGGPAKAVEDAARIHANTLQFFSRNPRGSACRNYGEEEIREFRRIRRERGFGPVLAHAPYTMNLASGNERTWEFASMVIREDILRMDALGMELLVFHPGSHVGIGADAGIQNIIRGLDQALTKEQHLLVLLETMSGKGTEIGASFEELARIREGVRCPEKLGICLDTCHIFAAGYDIVRDLDGVLEKFDRVLGLELLKAVHLNDSKMPLGSRKDRHAALGEGEIGLEPLLRVLKHPALQGLPFYLETPWDDAGHGREIAMLRDQIEG